MQQADLKLELRERKYVFWVGVVCTALFVPLSLAAILGLAVAGELAALLFCGLAFGGGVFLGVLLMLAYRNHRVVITLSECSFTNVWGKKREFFWSDVRRIKLQVTNASFKLRLLAEDGRMLAQAESTMENAARLLEFAKEQGVPVECRPAPWEEEEGQTPEWALPPADADWQYAHRRQIKGGLWALSVLEVAAFVGGFWMTSARYRSLLWCCLPLALYLYLVAFPKVFVWEKPARAPKEWKRAHLSFPFVLFLAPVLFMLLTAGIINLTDAGRAWMFGVGLFAVLLAVYWLRAPRKKGLVTTMVCLVLLLGLYSFACTYHLNYSLRGPAPVHAPAQVLRAWVSASSKSGDSYYILVDMGEAEPLKLGVSSSVYKAAEAGRPLELCQNRSVFGVPFILVHPARET